MNPRSCFSISIAGIQDPSFVLLLLLLCQRKKNMPPPYRHRVGMMTTLMLLAAAVAAVSAIHVTHQSMKLRRYTQGLTKFDLAVIEFHFNSTVAVGGLAAGGVKTYMTALTGANTTLNPLDSNAPATVRPDVQRAGGIGMLNCTFANGTHSATFRSDVPTHPTTGVPIGMYVVEPSDTPAASLARAFGGLRVDQSEIHSNRLAFVLPLNGTMNGVAFQNQGVTKEYISTWLCSMTFSPLGSLITLVDDEHNTTHRNTTSPIPLLANECTLADHTAMTAAISRTYLALHALTSSVPSVHMINALHAAVASVDLYEARIACPIEMSEFLHLKQEAFDVIAANTPLLSAGRLRQCQHARGTEAWTLSPCCNPEVAFTLCCDSTEVTSATVWAVNATTEVVATKLDPPLFRAMLSSHYDAALKAADAAEAPSPVARDEWLSLTTFLADCATHVTVQPCAKDVDCRYHPNICDVNAGTCRVSWEESEKALAKCYMERADTRLMAEWFQDWNINHATATSDQFAAALVQHASDYECVGATAAAHQSALNITFDEFGAPIVSRRPANPTTCEATPWCNWNAGTSPVSVCNDTNTVALKGTHMCGRRVSADAEYVDIRRKPKCQLTSFREANNNGAGCLATYPNAAYIYDNTYSYCYLPALDTPETCYALAPLCAPLLDYLVNTTALVNRTEPYRPLVAEQLAPYCNAPYLNGDGLTLGTFCYSQTVNESTCVAMAARAVALGQSKFTNALSYRIASGLFWASDIGACIGPFRLSAVNMDVLIAHANITTCRVISAVVHPLADAHALHGFHMSVRFTPGEYNTEEECELGMCNVPSYNFTGAVPVECANRNRCTKSCSRCANDLVPSDVTDVSPSYCLRGDGACPSPGAWITIDGTPHCKYLYDRHLCAHKGYAYYSCDDVTDPDVCTATGIVNPTAFEHHVALALSCKWKTNQICRTQAECESNSAQCNDHDTATCTCNAHAGCTCTTGACIAPWYVNATTGARRNCPLGSSTIVTTPIGCKETSVTTSAQCNALSHAQGGIWEWHAHATTSAQCAAHGTVCPSNENGAFGGLLGRGGEECTLCGSVGGVVPRYAYAPGIMVPGESDAGEWVERKVTTRNRYKHAVSPSLVESYARRYAAAVVMRAVQSTAGQLHAQLLPQIRAYVLHNAGDEAFRDVDPRIGFDESTGRISPMHSCTVIQHESEPQVCSSPFASLTFAPGEIERPGGDFIQLTLVDHGLLMANPSHLTNTTRALMAVPVGRGGIVFAAEKGTNVVSVGNSVTPLVPASNYAIVKEDGNATKVVGTILGNGVLFQFNGTGEFDIQLEYSHAIVYDNITYPVLAFGIEKPPYGIVPLRKTVTSNGLLLVGKVSSSDFPATADGVTSGGIYPIAVVVLEDSSSSTFWTWWVILLITLAGAAVLAGVFGLGYVLSNSKGYSPALQQKTFGVGTD